MTGFLETLDIAPPGAPQSALADYHVAMLYFISVACGFTAAEAARFIGAKQCLSCGAYQTITGSLPCDH
jgi:hypothetical protein